MHVRPYNLCSLEVTHMLQAILNALIPCISLAIIVGGLLFLTYKARERILSIKITYNSFEIKFDKDSKRR